MLLLGYPYLFHPLALKLFISYCLFNRLVCPFCFRSFINLRIILYHFSKVVSIMYLCFSDFERFHWPVCTIAMLFSTHVVSVDFVSLHYLIPSRCQNRRCLLIIASSITIISSCPRNRCVYGVFLVKPSGPASSSRWFSTWSLVSVFSFNGYLSDLIPANYVVSSVLHLLIFVFLFWN